VAGSDAYERFTHYFGSDGRCSRLWEAVGGESSWQPWMDITLTRQPST
jgi:hypothetical protein